jgi:hypothetical protein
MPGTVTIFECRSVTSQYIYRARVIDGDPVFMAFGIIDVPRHTPLASMATARSPSKASQTQTPQRCNK